MRIMFGECLIDDPTPSEETVKALVDEAGQQPWDTNAYIMVVNAETKQGALIIGAAHEGLESGLRGLRRYITTVSWFTVYMEGYGHILPLEQRHHVIPPENPRDEFRSLTFMSPDIKRQYAMIRSEQEKGMLLSAEGDILFSPDSNHGLAMIHAREFLGW